jgi:hypothetical protein
MDVDNADNCRSPAEKDVKNKRDRTAENRQVQFMTLDDAVTSQQSSRPTPERTIRRAKKPTPLSRRELLDKFTVFLQHKQKYKRVLSWLQTIEAQSTECSEEEMAGRPGRGKKLAPKKKTATPPLEVEEDWDQEIAKEETE